MFKKLRNKLILINLGITTMVIVVVFAMIYVISTKTAEGRPPEFRINAGNESAEESSVLSISRLGLGDTEEWQKLVNFSVRQEKKTAAEQLLITLVVSGIAIELTVIMVSYFMAEEAIKPVKDAYEAQKVFIANASHEIKTPIAAIVANLEAADIQRNKWISNVEKETEKLSRLNAELLTLARTDLTTETEAREVNIRQLTEKILDGFEPRLLNKKLKRDFKLSREVIKINAADYEQILSILMDNAVKYSNSRIFVQLSDHELIIENDGAKIPAEKLAHVFDRFYQTDKTREGAGLGLSIAKSVAERNKWRLEASCEKNVRFRLLNF